MWRVQRGKEELIGKNEVGRKSLRMEKRWKHND
jgi:hypothetical protein